MNADAASLPEVHLDRSQTIRLAIVGALVILALVRVAPDLIRFAYPLHVFGYRTDGNATVVYVAPRTAPASPGIVRRTVGEIIAMTRRGKAPQPRATPATDAGDRVMAGDRVRVDRIPPFDRKGGLVGPSAYTYDNPVRFLPIERGGREQILRLTSREESARLRLIDMLRIFLCIAAVAIGALLFIIKPSITTAAFFVFCLAAVEAPSTFFDTIIPQPWRPILPWIDDMIRGAVRPALLLFALCLIDGDRDPQRERLFAWVTGAIALVLGTLNAYAQWRLNYGALPAEDWDRAFRAASYTISSLTVVAIAIAFIRAPRNDRHKISWIAAAFLFAGVARLLSDTLFPINKITLWQNGLLVSATIVPIVTIWIAVLRHQFFNVDFVVSRAVVYTALSAAAIGLIWLSEELIYYAFYQYADFAYLVFSVVTLAIGISTGKIVEMLVHLVDRFIFRDRMEQRHALEFIGGYILDAETVDDVYRALLQDAAHALKLSFGGILGRQPDGGYTLAETYNWPANFDFKLGPSDELTRAITRTRGALTFSGKDTRLIQRSFANEGLTFAAPLFFDRTVSGIVVYGHNVSGLDLDPEERELLVRVVAHASIALNTIELNRYRVSNAPAPLPLPST